MGPSILPHPGEANVTEAFAVIRSTWNRNVDLIVRGQCSFWLGSGISAARFDALDVLIRNLLSKLQSLSNGSAHCPYRKALTDIIQQTSILVASIDFSQPPTTWARVDEIVAQLRNRYSAILGIPVLDSGSLSIPWDILKLQITYADDSKEPDSEHRCLAVMIEEGFISDLVTTNWDPLIEKAYKQCRGTKSSELEIVACNDDLSNTHNGTAPRILKIHGCAKKSVAEPSKYQPFMVASADEIAKWDSAAEPLAEATRTLLRETPALFIGLSGQDFNLKTLFAKIQAGRSEPFPPEPPRVIFTTSGLSPDHYSILKLLYGDVVYASHAAQLNKEAALPLYGKPLLCALYLLGLKHKISAVVQRGQGEIPAVFVDLTLQTLDLTEERLCNVFDAVTVADERWRKTSEKVSRYIARLMNLYQKQELPGGADVYEPITSFNVARIENLAPAAMGNLHWLFLALACIVEGEKRGYWIIEVPHDVDAATGHLVLRNAGDCISLFLIDRAMYRSRLEKLSLPLGPTPNRVVVLYPADTVPAASTRFPGRALPGAPGDPDDLTELSLQELLDGSTSVDALMDSLRKELNAGRTTW